MANADGTSRLIVDGLSLEIRVAADEREMLSPQKILSRLADEIQEMTDGRVTLLFPESGLTSEFED